MSKKSLLLCVSLVLTLALGLGGTLAFLTDTDAKVNTFTIGNVDIKLNENYEDGATLMPGVDVTKTASIANTGSSDAYVFMTVAVPAATLNGATIPVVTPNFQEIGWSYKESGAPIVLDGENYLLYAFTYDTALVPNAVTSTLLQSITLDARVDYNPFTGKYAIVVAGEAADIDANLNAGKVYVNAFAIQTEGFASAADAYYAYLTQWTADGAGWTQDQIIIPGLSASEPGAPTPVKKAITAAELAELLNEAGTGTTDVTIELMEDIEVTDAWTPVYINGYNGAQNVTIQGNGHTISGLTAPLFKGGFAGNSGIIINDLTIADSNIVGTDNTGIGAFIGAVDSMSVVILKNCHLKHSSVVDESEAGSRVGGLIGWNAGYNNVNDGPVFLTVTIDGCTVEDCLLISKGSVGGIVGHAGANPNTLNDIKNCSVIDSDIASTNTSSFRAGAIVGTANTGSVVITGCTSTNTNVAQLETDNPAGQSDLYGRFVPDGSNGSLIIDGDAQ